MANLLSAVSVVCSLSAHLCPRQYLPVVDLGYTQHQAIEFNQQGGYYNFSNIRYAQPPVGNMRFMAPQKPKGKSNKIDNGSVGRICPQASGAWEDIVEKFLEDYFFHKHFNYSKVAKTVPKKPPPMTDPRETEDCLFLDVNVPQTVFNSGKASAPVLVWIYGGGYTGGEKTGNGQYNPTGLLEASPEPFVQVALNYRLGAMGWLGGPKFQGQGGIANAGLYDQRLALEWVQDNIHLFGGDKKKVTVMGESAGAGSIMHHITAFGNEKGPAPFAKAIPQSPAFAPLVYDDQNNAIWEKFLKQLGAKNLKEAQKASSHDVIKANAFTAWTSTWGTFGYGPSVDGVIVPKLPGQLLAEGKYDKNVQLLTSHVALEGLEFTSPQIKTQKDYANDILTSFPDMPKNVLKYVENKLYPSSAFKNQFERTVATTQDVAFVCNAVYLNSAFNAKTYAYEFADQPAVHGADVPYTWWFGSKTVDVPVAKTMQDYITSFMVNGKPVSKGHPDIPMYGTKGELVVITSGTNVKATTDINKNARCSWWQKALYA